MPKPSRDSRPPNSHQMFALLSAEMDEAEQAAVWTLVRYLKAKELAWEAAMNAKLAGHYAALDEYEARMNRET